MKLLLKLLTSCFICGVAAAATPLIDVKLSGTGNQVTSGATLTAKSGSTFSWENGATFGGDKSAFRTQTGLVIGTDVQAYDADLTTYAGITPSANVQSLLGAANYAAMKTLLGYAQADIAGLTTASSPTFAGLTLPGLVFTSGTITGTGAVSIAGAGASGDITLAPANTGGNATVKILGPSAENAVLLIENPNGASWNTFLRMKNNGSNVLLFGAAGGTDSFVTGAAAGDVVLRNEAGGNLLLSTTSSYGPKVVGGTDQLRQTKTTASTSTTTGSLVNDGGFGNAGALYNGGVIYAGSGANALTNAAGKLLGVPGPVFNVKTDYGAALDGTTDDTTPITNAIAAAVAAGGGTVYFSGIGKITTTLTISSSVGIRLLGGERNTCGLKASSQTLGTILSITGSNVTLENMKIDGVYVSGASSGAAGLVTIDDAHDTTVKNCLILNSLRNGILILGDAQRVRIFDTKLTNNYCSIRSFPDTINNQSPQAITVQRCELVDNWDHSGGDQTGGIKLEANGSSVESSNHLIDDNIVANVGSLMIEFWGGQTGILSNSVISNNRIFANTAHNDYGVSLNACHQVTVIGNTLKMDAGFVALELANGCEHCQVIGNNVDMHESDGSYRSGAHGVGVFHNVDDAPAYNSIKNNIITGAGAGIQVQTAIETEIIGNRISDGNTMIVLQNASHVTASLNRLEGPCSAHVFVDASTNDISDIEFSYNWFIGDATYRNFWSYNNDTAHTLTNFRFHHNVAHEATFTGYDSWWLGYDTAELINVRRYANEYTSGAGKVDWPDYYSPDVILDEPFLASQQQYSIPVAKKFSFTVAANAGDQWFKIYSAPQGFPISVKFHIFAYFAGTADNRNTSVTLEVMGSPYDFDCAITKLPDGNYQGGVVKEVIYDNPSSGSTQEIWIRIGPTAGGAPITIAGSDFPLAWITAPTAVTTEPTWATTFYKCDLSQHRPLFSREIGSDVFRGVELSAAPAAPATNGFKVYAVDNGSGKTVLKVRFATGAEQTIATEP